MPKKIRHGTLGRSNLYPLPMKSSIKGQLLYRPHFHPDECLPSYLIRVSNENGFQTVTHMMKSVGFNWSEGNTAVQRYICEQYQIGTLMSPLSLDYIVSPGVTLFSRFQQRIKKPYIFSKRPRICPNCIQQNGYAKFEWSVLPIIACPKHRILLCDTHKDDDRPLSWFRKSLLDDDAGDLIIQPLEPESPLLQISQLFSDLLEKDSTSSSTYPPMVSNCDIVDAFSIVHFLLRYQQQTPIDPFDLVGKSTNSLSKRYKRAWKAINGDKSEYYNIIYQYRKNPLKSNSKGGINNHFGSIQLLLNNIKLS